MLTLNLYLQDYDISNEWAGDWFEVSSVDEIKEAVRICANNGVEEILTADYEGPFSYRDLGGEGMLYFLESYFEEFEKIYEYLDNPIILDYFIGQYRIETIFDRLQSTNIDIIPKDRRYLSNNELIGYYFSEFLDLSDVPDIFKNYFDYEAYGRDIILGGFYTLLEDSHNLYLIFE